MNVCIDPIITLWRLDVDVSTNESYVLHSRVLIMNWLLQASARLKYSSEVSMETNVKNMWVML